MTFFPTDLIDPLAVSGGLSPEPFQGQLMRKHSRPTSELKWKDELSPIPENPVPASFDCDLCSKSYQRKGALVRHQKHGCAGTLEKSRYPCQLCPYAAHYKHDLNRHVILRHSIPSNRLILQKKN